MPYTADSHHVDVRANPGRVRRVPRRARHFGAGDGRPAVRRVPPPAARPQFEPAAGVVQVVASVFGCLHIVAQSCGTTLCSTIEPLVYLRHAPLAGSHSVVAPARKPDIWRSLHHALRRARTDVIAASQSGLELARPSLYPI